MRSYLQRIPNIAKTRNDSIRANVDHDNTIQCILQTCIFPNATLCGLGRSGHRFTYRRVRVVIYPQDIRSE